MKFCFILLFICSCTHNYSLKPCIKTNKNKLYNKLIVSKKARVKIDVDTGDEISLYSEDKEYQLVKSKNNYFYSNSKLEVGKYFIDPELKHVKKVSYVWDEDELFNNNTKKNKMKIIKSGKTTNSVSKCMCDTDDWYILKSNNKCYKSKLNVNLVSRSNNLNFEIIENGNSNGIININTSYELNSKNENILHIFSSKNEVIRYFINIQELCYPKKTQVKVISFVNKKQGTGILLNQGSNDGIVKDMKFYYIDNNNKSLKTCFIDELNVSRSLCVFKNLKISKLPKNVMFTE